MRSTGIHSQRGAALAYAIVGLAIVFVVIFTATFLAQYGSYQSSQAYDSYTSQLIELGGLQELVDESVLAVAGTRFQNSSSSITTEISNRLGALPLTSGVSLSLTAASTPQANLSYPLVDPAPVATAIPMFNTSGAQLAGNGNRALFFLSRGPAALLGTGSYTFTRSVAASNETRTESVTTNLYSVPLTNVDCIAYGLPASGTVPTSAPAMPIGFFGSNVSRLVVTANDPSRDFTFFPDTFDPSNSNSHSFQYQNPTLFAWDAYEYIWGATYQNALITKASNNNGLYDFDAPGNPAAPAGVTPSGNTVAIDASAVTAPVLAIVDGQGGRTIQISFGAGGGTSAFVLLLKNSGSGLTTVTFSGTITRPILIYSRQCALVFNGSPQLQGAILLDRNSTASGACTLFGHLSFYATASPFPNWGLTLNDSSGIRSSLAPISPRVLVVGTTGSRGS